MKTVLWLLLLFTTNLTRAAAWLPLWSCAAIKRFVALMLRVLRASRAFIPSFKWMLVIYFVGAVLLQALKSPTGLMQLGILAVTVLIILGLAWLAAR